MRACGLGWGACRGDLFNVELVTITQGIINAEFKRERQVRRISTGRAPYEVPWQDAIAAFQKERNYFVCRRPYASFRKMWAFKFRCRSFNPAYEHVKTKPTSERWQTFRCRQDVNGARL